MLQPGSVLQNRYRVLRWVGGGGMGEVYLAEDTRLPGRHCAIKEMSPAQLKPQDRNWAIQSFQREAQILARLRHPGLTAVSDYFPEGGNWYLVVDYVEGETLEERLKWVQKGQLPGGEALDIVRQLCAVLEYLHGQSPPVVFRDLKPGNVMITPQEEVRLIDFGIARYFKPGQTQDTVKLGTPGYAAPEQYSSRSQSDARSDVYGLGVLLHQMLTGYDPTTTPLQLPLARHLNPGIRHEVEQAIVRATQLDADARYQRVSDFCQALPQTFPPPSLPSLTPPPHLTRLVGLLGLLGLLVVVAGVIIYTIRPRPTPTPSTLEPTVTLLSAATSTPTTTPTATPTPSPTPTLLKQVVIPGGAFIRGSTPADLKAVVSQLCPDYQDSDSWCRESSFQDELAEFQVPRPTPGVRHIDSNKSHLESFHIGRYEVTNAEYARCVDEGACTAPVSAGPNPRHAYFRDPQYADHPVVYATWYNAQVYCAWIGARLPTADEWEKAARGADGRWWTWGNQKPTAEANFRRPGEAAAKEKDTIMIGDNPAPVGSYPSDKSPYGVMDMAGNVMEWVDAWYNTNKGYREIRGGSWNTGSYALRSANRAGRSPNASYFDVGFRCARDANP